MNREKRRSEVVKKLKELYKEGYQYVVRDEDMPYLVCFSIKPKRYRDIQSWGYADPYAQGVLPAYPIRNIDITEINYSNKSATLIEGFIEI